MRLVSGQSLSFYEILGSLGAGAMGEVYRARDTRLDREVAIKVLPAHLAEEEDQLRRFEREAKALARLNHPNVAQIFGVDKVETTCFLVLELVSGETLEQSIARGALPVDRALDVGRQIAEGLEAAHEAGVIHRDLKPANVMITPDGVVKVLDFGLAKPIRPGESGDGASTGPSDSFLVTEEGLVLGTPTYMSPEQARGNKVDRRTDIWAFGCVLYECLTGGRAFAGDTMTDLLAAIVHEEPDWSALPAATPPSVRELLERALTKDPRERLRDVGEARLTLARAGGRDSGGPAGTESHARAPAAGSSGPPRWAVAVAGVLVLVILAVWITDRLASSVDDDASARGTIAAETVERASIAVLPFTNLSGDPDTAPFVNGLHADLIVRLSKVEGLTVISSRAFSGLATSTVPIREIAEDLGVSTILQVRVQRSGSVVRITAQLIDGRDERSLWTEGYEDNISVENVFEVQAALVELIAVELARELTDDERAVLREPPTTNPAAFESYVRGRYSWLGLTGQALERSLDYFSEAISLDASYASAHSAIADTYLAMEFVGALSLEEAVVRARQAVEEALRIDPDLAEAKAALGHVYLHEMDGPNAEQELRRAIDLNPSFLEAHMFLGMALLDWGRLGDAERFTNAGLEVDPRSTYGAWGAGLVRFAREDYTGAAEHFQRAVDLEGYWVGHYELAWALSALGEHERAAREIELALSKASGALAQEFGLESTAAAFKALAGDTIEARASLERLSGTAEAPFALGLAHFTLGDVDEAFDLWLNQTDWTILLPTHFRYGPMLEELRDDPRYQAVLDRIDEQWGW